MNYSMNTNNKKVFDFYKENPTINFEDMNIVLVDILTKIVKEISPSMDSTFAFSIINEMKNINNKLNNNDNIFNNKFGEFKKEYISDINSILKNNNNDNIKPLLLEYNQILQDKTKIMLNEIIPKNNEKITNEINNSFGEINRSVMEIKSINSESNGKVNEVLKKFENSSSKGNMSEMIIFNLLKSMYSEKQLKIVATTKETGDILLTRNNKTTIIIENKNYTSAVIQSEVDKFIRDLNTQNCSGIFISQNSEIANKKIFEIAFYGNNIGIFIANVKYNTDKIQMAIDTIDAIKSKIKDIEYDNVIESIEIPVDDMECINNEYNIILNKKLIHIKTIKDFSKKLLTEAEDFNIPTLSNFLDKVYGSNKNKEWECHLCDFCGKNKAGLASHQKKHDNQEKRKMSN